MTAHQPIKLIQAAIIVSTKYQTASNHLNKYFDYHNTELVWMVGQLLAYGCDTWRKLFELWMFDSATYKEIYNSVKNL